MSIPSRAHCCHGVALYISPPPNICSKPGDILLKILWACLSSTLEIEGSSEASVGCAKACSAMYFRVWGVHAGMGGWGMCLIMVLSSLELPSRQRKHYLSFGKPLLPTAVTVRGPCKHCCKHWSKSKGRRQDEAYMPPYKNTSHSISGCIIGMDEASSSRNRCPDVLAR